MYKMAVAGMVVGLTALAGCAPTSGVITGSSGPVVGTKASDFQYVSAEGAQATFDKVRYPVAVLAFTSAPGATCCWLEPRVAGLSEQMHDLPVTVAQVSLPTGKCPHGKGCTEACNLHKFGLMSLCDADGIVWKAYGKPEAGTVVLIGKDNMIVQTGMLADLNARDLEAACRIVEGTARSMGIIVQR